MPHYVPWWRVSQQCASLLHSSCQSPLLFHDQYHQLVSECYDRMGSLCCWRKAMAFFVKVKTFNKRWYMLYLWCYWYSPLLMFNRKYWFKEVALVMRIKFTMKNTWFELMHTFTFLVDTQYNSCSHTHHQQHPRYNYHHHCPWLNSLTRTYCTRRMGMVKLGPLLHSAVLWGLPLCI